MLQEINQNVWDIADDKSIICILTNNSIINNRNVMGAGIAKEALDRNPDLDKQCANCIDNNSYILGTDKQTGAILFRFPTKNDVWYNSSLSVIEDSLRELAYTARLNKNYKIYLPRPGCGCGGLNWESQVKALCETYLNDLNNVYIIYK